MYGRTVRTLNVILTGNGQNVTVWRMNGTQGDVWKQARIDIGGSNLAFATQVSVCLCMCKWYEFVSDTEWYG